MEHGEITARHYATREIVRVKWQNNIITEIEPAAGGPEVDDTWIAPGLVDLQVNGFGGIDFQQDNLTVDDLLNAVRQLHEASCSRFLLTLITDEWPKMTARLRHLKSLRAQSEELQSAIAGWHIEGPFLSAEPGFHGAHNPALMLDPTPEHIRELRDITGSDPLLLTLAPERLGAVEAIALATSLGIKISLGHTNASAEILRAAVQSGATAFTHLGNACPHELNKYDNIIWRVIDTPGLTVSLIPDRIHVSDSFFRMVHRALKPESIYYTTDAMAAAGAGPGKYKLGAMEVEVGTDQIVRQPGQTNFAGSALRANEGVTRATKMLRCDWQDSWIKFSDTPAKLMGLSHGIQVGQKMDCFVFEVKRRKKDAAAV